MGFLCCRTSSVKHSVRSSRDHLSSKPLSEVKDNTGVSRRGESVRHKDKDIFDNDNGTVVYDKKANGSARVHGKNPERKTEKTDFLVERQPTIKSMPKAIEGEYIAAGWPPWLAAVAGEAIKGWVPRRAESFEKLDKIGQGTYSNVYRARDLDRNKIVALKKVRFDNLEPESVRFMAREIHILRRLDHPNIIKLEGLVTSRMSCSLYLVFEYMEHDLSGLASHPDLQFSESQVKCYIQQLLRGLDHCHSRGVLHRDIKGSNLLIDNNGILKIADFGLASMYDPHHSQPMTSRVVTLWYRPPELLLGATYYGTAVDLWSTGCILAELYAGKPIMPGRTEVEQLHKIFKLCGSPSEDYWKKSKLPHTTIFKPQQPYKRRVAETFKEFPAPSLALMEVLLAIDPADRGSADSALKSEFFTTRPLPCDPSSLPKYPPSKEFDAKLREEERSCRLGAAGGKGQRRGPERRGSEAFRAVPAPEANAELAASIQKRKGQANSKSKSELFNPCTEEFASGFPIDPPRPSQVTEESCPNTQGAHHYIHKRASYSGPLANRAAWTKTGKNPEDAPSNSVRGDLSTMSGLVAARKSPVFNDGREKYSAHSHEDGPKAARHTGRFPRSFKPSGPESLGLDDQTYHIPAGFPAIDQRTRDEERATLKDPLLLGYSTKAHKIQYSGPLLIQAGNVDKMLKEHDRQIQEAGRRSRMDKARIKRSQQEQLENQISTSSYSMSGR
ncbi:unnamed protein product [Rhodiola kirilowii]